MADRRDEINYFMKFIDPDHYRAKQALEYMYFNYFYKYLDEQNAEYDEQSEDYEELWEKHSDNYAKWFRGKYENNTDQFLDDLEKESERWAYEVI